MARPGGAKFDLLVIADFRVGDTGAPQTVNLVRAAAEAGYSVAVMPCFGSARTVPFRMDAGWRALGKRKGVTAVAAGAPVRARLTLAVDFRLFSHRARHVVDGGDKAALLFTRGFRDMGPDPAEAFANAVDMLGMVPRLLPAAAAQRQALAQVLPDQNIAPEDWTPVVHPGQRPERPERRTTLPALGFCRANAARGWPSDAEALTKVLPDHPLIALKVLSAPAWARAALTESAGGAAFFGRGTDIPAFLEKVDLLAVPDRAQDDPYPEEALAALEAGTIPLMRRGAQGQFFGAAVYARPSDMADTAVDIFSNRSAAEEVREVGRELLDRHFAPRLAIGRLEGLIGAPGPTPLAARATLRPKRRVLSLSTNGIGMGHLTRQIAIANAADPAIDTVFLGFSQAIHTVRKFGYAAEYLPFLDSIGLDPDYWNASLAKSLESAVRFYGAEALILDANYPFHGLTTLKEKMPSLPLVWVRRAMWGEGRDLGALERTHLFDLVIEPGELATAYDTGPTKGARGDASHVGPISLVAPRDQLSREAAAADLGIEAHTLNVLVMPGSGNNFDAGGLWDRIFAHLGSWAETRIVVAEWAIAEDNRTLPDHVIRARGYPFARWFKAFDFAISAAGYNSFVDLTSLGLPAIFVPNENPLMDRQDLRALYADRHGLGKILRKGETHRVQPLLDEMKREGTRDAIAARLAALPADNGASTAADLISALVTGNRAHHARAWQH